MQHSSELTDSWKDSGEEKRSHQHVILSCWWKKNGLIVLRITYS